MFPARLTLKLQRRLRYKPADGESPCRHRRIDQSTDYVDSGVHSVRFSGRSHVRPWSRDQADIEVASFRRTASPHQSVRTSGRDRRSKSVTKREPAFDSIVYWSGEATPAPSPSPPSTIPPILKHEMFGGYESPKNDKERRRQEKKDNKERERRAKLFARTPEEMERKSRTYRRLARWNPDSEVVDNGEAGNEKTTTGVQKWPRRKASFSDDDSQMSPTFVPP